MSCLNAPYDGIRHLINIIQYNTRSLREFNKDTYFQRRCARFPSQRKLPLRTPDVVEFPSKVRFTELSLATSLVRDKKTCEGVPPTNVTVNSFEANFYK